eukprot:12458673-Ditylum_brightwellii.AAC.1
MKEAAEHVPFKLPNEFTRVGFLLARITSSDAELQATMANIKSDADPTSKFPSGTKRDAMKISDVSGSGFGMKPST